MPRFDRTGPLGMGPRTGRGFGPCGMGLGWGRGFGRFTGMPYTPTLTRDEEVGVLKEEAKELEDELKTIKDRIARLAK